MTRFSYVQRADPGERFARDAFAGQIGKQLPLRIGAHHGGMVTVIAAEVSPDGTSVEITVERAAQQEGSTQATTTCPSPQCDRLVASPNTYCCTACRGVGGGLHSEGCNARRAERAAQREEIR